MNRNITSLFITLSVASTLVFQSCKEIPVSVSTVVSEDTTYLASIETPQQKMVLVEEFSGVHCVNCGLGSDILKDLETNTYNGKMNVASIHSAFLAQPYENETINGITYNSEQDFRSEDANNIVNQIFGGDPAKPAAAMDRLKIGNSGGENYFGDRFQFSSMVGQALQEHPTTPVNIEITNTAKGNNEYTIEVKVSYTEAMTGQQGITVYALENDINDLQLYPDSVHHYTFEHIFRKLVSSLNGDAILPNATQKEAGRVYIRRYTLKIDPTDAKQALWKPENMEILAFVNTLGSTDKRVYQSKAVKLIP